MRHRSHYNACSNRAFSRLGLPAELSQSSKGQKKLLDDLSHRFAPWIRPAAVTPREDFKIWGEPCLVYASSRTFGEHFPTIAAAYEALGDEDSWLIVAMSHPASIYRPEALSGQEVFLNPGQRKHLQG